MVRVIFSFLLLVFGGLVGEFVVVFVGVLEVCRRIVCDGVVFIGFRMVFVLFSGLFLGFVGGGSLIVLEGGMFLRVVGVCRGLVFSLITVVLIFIIRIYCG